MKTTNTNIRINNITTNCNVNMVIRRTIEGFDMCIS